MCDLSREYQLLFEPRQDCGVLSQVGTNDLKSDRSPDFDVVSLINGPHPTHPQQLGNLIPLPEDVSFSEDGSADGTEDRARLTGGTRTEHLDCGLTVGRTNVGGCPTACIGRRCRKSCIGRVNTG